MENLIRKGYSLVTIADSLIQFIFQEYKRGSG